MNPLQLHWEKNNLHFLIGDQEILKFEVNDRFDYGGVRRRPRNTAVRLTTIAQFSPNYNPSKQMNWRETIEVLRKYGASEDEIARLVHIGVQVGWNDVEEVMTYNGQGKFL